MTLATDEFIRRFLIHVLPRGFHRIRHYGLFAKAAGADNIARARELLAVPKPQSEPAEADAADPNEPACPCCGGRMIIIETFERGCDAAPSANRSDDRDQDRHLMTTARATMPQMRSLCSLVLDRPRQRSPKYPTARLKSCAAIFIVQRRQPLAHAAASPLGQRAGSSRPPSPSSTAAIKSP